MEQERNQFEEYADKHNAAFEAFNKVYEAKHPPPELGKADRSDWFVPVGLLVMVAASIIVSGSRTIEEFGGGLIGWAAFVMVEIAIIAFAFYITRMNTNIDRVEYTRKLAWAGVILAFIVGVSANLADVLRKHGIYVSPEVATVLNGLVAVSAPALAFISGHILAVEYLRFARRSQDVNKLFNEQMAEYQEAKLRSWQSQQGRWGVGRSVEASQPSNLIKNNQISPRNKPSPRLQKALNWLEENPGHLDTPPRELERKVGVSYGTIYSAQKLLKGDKDKRFINGADYEQ